MTEYNFTLSENSGKGLIFSFCLGRIGYRSNTESFSTNITHITITEDWLNILIASFIPRSALKITHKGQTVNYSFIEFKKYYDFCKSLSPAPEPKEMSMSEKITQQIATMVEIESGIMKKFQANCCYILGAKHPDSNAILQEYSIAFEKIGSGYYCNIKRGSKQENCLLYGTSMFDVLVHFYSLERILINETERLATDLTIYGAPLKDFIRSQSGYIIYCAEKQPTDEDISKRARLIYQRVTQE
jgi:hypothetical protein